jgi:nuclear transport factor 2 (NTF2) superfamily protein
LQRIQIKQSKMSQEHLTKLVKELYFAFHGNTILILISFCFLFSF